MDGINYFSCKTSINGNGFNVIEFCLFSKVLKKQIFKAQWIKVLKAANFWLSGWDDRRYGGKDTVNGL